MEIEEYTPRSACESLKVYDEKRKKKKKGGDQRGKAATYDDHQDTYQHAKIFTIAYSN